MSGLDVFVQTQRVSARIEALGHRRDVMVWRPPHPNRRDLRSIFAGG